MTEPPDMDPMQSLSAASGYEASSGNVIGAKVVQGYDYEFVPPPDSRYECAICMLVLREPRQTNCGHRFCKDCILKWLREGHNRCPVDNTDISENDLFPDNFAKREIQNFNVLCPNKDCDVITTVLNLPAHQSECPLSLVPCPNKCTKVLLRRDLEGHVKNTCDQRYVQCPDCGGNFFAVELEMHLQSCPQGKVKCPHCQEEIIREKFKSHEDETCPKKVILCSFTCLGCSVQVERSEMEGHLRSCMTSHMSLLCHAVSRICEHLHLNPVSGSLLPFPTRELSPTEMSVAMSSIAPAVHQLSIDSGTFRPPSDVRFLQQGNPGLSLPPSTYPFRSSLATGSLDSAASSAQAIPTPLHRSPSDPKYLSTGTREGSYQYMSGPADDGSGVNMSPSSMLSQADSTAKSLSLLQEEQKLVKHDQSLLELRAKMDTYKQKIKMHEQQLSEMEGRLCNGQFFWKIRNYSKYQREAERGETTALHSQPFYTSPSGGYKLCVRANLNGVDAARGSHLSLFIHFMQGEYDDVLEWPFSGRIILSVMDQNDCCELRNHVAETLASKPNLAAFQRPSTPRNHKGFGYMEFLPLSALKHSPYIKNDTLIIKAHVLPNG